MTRFTGSLVTVATVLTWMLVTPAHPQTTSSGPAPLPGASPAQEAPAQEAPKDKQVEGTIKKVDPMTKTVEVSSGIFNLFGATLQVGDETQIRVDGRQESLVGVREGAKVKASYEVRDGKNVAKSIEVTPATEGTGESGTRPAPPSSPPSSMPGSGEAPSSGGAPSGQSNTNP
jgi:Cu/Ag efflux protein CusF